MAKTDASFPTVDLGWMSWIRQVWLGLRFFREDLPPDLKAPVWKCCASVSRIVSTWFEDPFSEFDRVYAAEHGCQP